MKKEQLVQKYHEVRGSSSLFNRKQNQLIAHLGDFLFKGNHHAANKTLDEVINYEDFRMYLGKHHSLHLIDGASDNTYSPTMHAFLTQWENEVNSHDNTKKSRKKLSLNTQTYGKSKFIVREIFKGTPAIPVEKYRIQPFTHIVINNDQIYAQPELQDNIKVIDPLPTAIETDPSGDYEYYGIIDIQAHNKEWQPLPTPLTPYDEITALKASTDIEIGYSETTHSYYIRRQSIVSDTSMTIEYNIRSRNCELLPTNTIHAKDLENVTKKIQAKEITLQNIKQSQLMSLDDIQKAALLEQFFNSFSEGKLPESSAHSSPQAFDDMLSNRIGVCLHRSLLFLALAEQLQVDNVYIMTNDLHAFMEFSYKGLIFSIDLGGGEAEIEIKPSPVAIKKYTFDFPKIDFEKINMLKTEMPTLSANITIPQLDSFLKPSQGNVSLFFKHDEWSAKLAFEDKDIKVDMKPHLDTINELLKK